MRRRSRKYRRRSHYYSRRKKNWIPFLVFVGVVGFFFWAIFQFFSVLLSSVRTETTAAELNIERGRAEFQLSTENSNWTPAFSGQTFVEGDQLKTAKNSTIRLNFFDDSTLFLNEETELAIEKLEKNNSDKKTASFHLSEGQIWGHSNETLTTAPKDISYTIGTDRLNLYIKGTIFHLETNSEQDILRLMKGEVEADILNEESQTIKTLSIGVGQQLVVNSETLNQITENQDVLTLIDSEFLTSNWHISNLENFDTEGAEKLKAQATPQTTEVTTIAEEEPISEENLLDPVEILEPAEGASIPANLDLIKIVGTAPLETTQIQVNGYTLSKYQPGDRKWSYFAATKFGTLKSGTNTYEVIAFSRDGKQSAPVTLTINYEGATPQFTPIPSSTETTNSTETTTTLPAPKISNPPIFAEDPTAVYETSAAVVTIAGTVSSSTQAVEVNNFRLRKFSPGDTTFSYIANANYGNMKEGENTFTIVAIGPNQERSEQAIKIFYSPVDVQ